MSSGLNKIVKGSLHILLYFKNAEVTGEKKPLVRRLSLGVIDEKV